MRRPDSNSRPGTGTRTSRSSKTRVCPPSRLPYRLVVSDDTWKAADGPVTFNLPGRLGMTRGTLGKISGVQFFITASQQPKMIRRYPCFGEVVSGSDVVFDITAVPTYGNGLPVNDVVIEKIRIFKIGEPKPIPEPVPYQPTPATPQPLIRD